MLAVFIIIILRTQQKRKQLHQKELLEQEFKTREKAMLQISRDLHDDIGSSLSGISMLSQLAQQQLTQSNNGSANELLQKIMTYTNDIIEKVSEMAWLMKPNQESLSILINKLKGYSITTAASKNIVTHFDHIPEIFGKELSIQQRKTIYLISKEAINNAIKYADCTVIHYSIYLTSGMAGIFIKDNGKGFNLTSVNAGSGLINMKARAAEINAILKIDSLPGKGTTIELQL